MIIIEDKVISLGGNSLSIYGLPATVRTQDNPIINEIDRERNNSHGDLQSYITEIETKLTNDQKTIYDKIIGSVRDQEPKIYFIDAPGGTGKTFLLNLLLTKVRSRNLIALAVASSGIAATLLKGGKTAHTTFKLPLDLVNQDEPTCSISRSSSLAELFRQCKLIVWDECTMSHKKAIESVDRMLKDVRNNYYIMGGVTVVLAGDFRQTLPVIPKGTKADEIHACIKSSELWRNVHILNLMTNMRALLNGNIDANIFSENLLKIGNGTIDYDQNGFIEILCGKIVENIENLKKSVFPDILNNYTNINWLVEPSILAPKNKDVDKLNLNMLNEMRGTLKEYKSFDSVENIEEAVRYPTEFINSLRPPGFPEHNLKLKIGAPIMLLRNIDLPKLSNGTRMIVKNLNDNIIVATILNGNYTGHDVHIPRISLRPTNAPFQFKRVQFPVKLCFGMTINKAQGQTMKVIGLNLEDPCFSHGQLYVGCSRVGDSNNLYILTHQQKTYNIVYKEIL